MSLFRKKKPNKLDLSKTVFNFANYDKLFMRQSMIDENIIYCL